ncbi:MAG TPA: hypothetical protein VGA15_16760 [Bradyrhizobium sp.]
MAKTTEESKASMLEAFETLFNQRDYEAAKRYWSSNYIQHIAPGGATALRMRRPLAAASEAQR